MAETPHLTWKTWAIATAMSVASSVGAFVSSHWGGVTSDDLKNAEKRIGVRIDGVEAKVASESDSTKKYVDKAITASEERQAPLKKKPKKPPHPTETREP